MKEWNSKGYFKPDLPIRLGETGSFYPLGLLLRPIRTTDKQNLPRTGDVLAYKNMPGPAEVMVYTKCKIPPGPGQKSFRFRLSDANLAQDKR